MRSALPFANRADAGRALAELVRKELSPPPDTLVLGLVRGGAEVAAALATELGLGWDILIVRKLGAPSQPEYAVGAYAETGSLKLNPEALRQLRLSEQWIRQATAHATTECRQLSRELRGSEQVLDLSGKQVILTDDGMATGFSMFCAIAAAIKAGASGLAVAVPVLSVGARVELERLGVAHCSAACPPDFRAVGQYYNDFAPVSSQRVSELLSQR